MSKSKWMIGGLYIGAAFLGWSIAFGGSQYIQRLLTLEDPSKLKQVAVSQAAAPQSKKRPHKKPKKNDFVRIINSRNIFDSTQANKLPEPTPGLEGEAAISDIDAQLMGTIVMKPEAHSLAWIRINSSNKSTAYGVGSKLLDATVEKIESEHVWLRRNNALELLKMYGDQKGTPSKSAKSKQKKDKNNDSGISKNGKDRYVVDQSVFDELLANPEKLYSQIRATEHKSDGEVDGYRVSGIRRKSIFYKLGVKNGDIIHNVNGMPLTNINGAMEAYQSLQSSRDFSFEITRRKKKRKMEYEVR